MRLIDADALMMIFCERPDYSASMFKKIRRRIDIAPTIDPVKHGKWGGTHGATCNLCGYIDVAAYIGRRPNYCPSCGAKMDKDSAGGENK